MRKARVLAISLILLAFLFPAFSPARAGKPAAALLGGADGFRRLAEKARQLGVHLMPIEWEHKVPEIVERAKLLPRPEV